MEFTQDYWPHPQQAPISPPETCQNLHRRPSVPYQEPCQNRPHPLSPLDFPYDRQIPRQTNHNHNHHHSPVIQPSRSNTYSYTFPASSSCNPFRLPMQPPLDTVTDFYNLYNMNVPATPPVYHMNQNLLPFPFPPIINPNQQQNQNLSSSPTTLPTVTHIPLLTGWSDWGPWFAAVGNHIGNLGLIPHVCDDPKQGDPFDPGRIPTYPPVITMLSTQAELSAWESWWRSDGIAGHILTSRLSASAHSQLLVFNPLSGPQRRTAREVFGHLHRLFGGGDYTSSSALKNQLRYLHCGAHVVDYVTQWRAGIAQLNDSGYPFTLRELLEAFADHLPDMDHKPMKDLVYQSLNHLILSYPRSNRSSNVFSQLIHTSIALARIALVHIPMLCRRNHRLHRQLLHRLPLRLRLLIQLLLLLLRRLSILLAQSSTVRVVNVLDTWSLNVGITRMLSTARTTIKQCKRTLQLLK